MRIRRAQERDMEGINRLLFQVLTVHHNGRPDLFKENVKIYGSGTGGTASGRQPPCLCGCG